MFSFFKKDKTPKYDEFVWFKKSAKYEGIYNTLKEIDNQNKVIFLIAHFQQTLDEFHFILDKMSFSYRNISTLSDMEEVKSGVVFSLLSESIKSDYDLTKLSERIKNKEVQFIVLEHYPTLGKEEELLMNLQSLKKSSKATYHVSMDEELFKLFGSDRIKTILERMDIDEKESLNHAMISKSIKRAQQKISEHIKVEKPALSSKEWFEKNKVNL